MHILAKTKKNSIREEEETELRTTSRSQPQRRESTHTHALAQLRLARSHATHDERNDFPVRGFSSSHSLQTSDIYIYIYIHMCVHAHVDMNAADRDNL